MTSSHATSSWILAGAFAVIAPLVAPAAYADSMIQHADLGTWNLAEGNPANAGADLWSHSQVQVLVFAQDTTSSLFSAGGSTVFNTNLYADVSAPGTVNHIDNAFLVQNGDPDQDGVNFLSSTNSKDGWSMQSTNFVDYSNPLVNDTWSVTFDGFGSTDDLHLQDAAVNPTKVLPVTNINYSGNATLNFTAGNPAVTWLDPLGVVSFTSAFSTTGNNALPNNGFTNLVYTLLDHSTGLTHDLLATPSLNLQVINGQNNYFDVHFGADLGAGVDPTFLAQLDATFVPLSDLPVPEPTSTAILLLAGAGAAALRRRRKKS